MAIEFVIMQLIILNANGLLLKAIYYNAKVFHVAKETKAL